MKKRILNLRGLAVGLLLAIASAAAAVAQAAAPIPAVPQLMHEVEEHQKQLDKVRENYTFTSLLTTQDVDAGGAVKKTETVEQENFFVHGHQIQRTVKKNGQPLSAHDQQKETERVTRLVEKAEKTPPDQPLEGQAISVSRLLNIMDVSHPRRTIFRGRSTIVFDFAGRRQAKTHGLAEDMSKKLRGTIWIDEADRQVAHLEVSFADNFKIAGGLFASIQKGSNFQFDQAPVPRPQDRPQEKDPSPGSPASAVLWLPTGAAGSLQARVLLLKGVRQRFTERDWNFQRFHVEAEPSGAVHAVPQPAKQGSRLR